MDPDEVNIMNVQFVGTTGDTISVGFPKVIMTPDEALVHAAWLVALSDPLGDRFNRILERVLNT